jgi:hypothetical protein
MLCDARAIEEYCTWFRIAQDSPEKIARHAGVYAQRKDITEDRRDWAEHVSLFVHCQALRAIASAALQVELHRLRHGRWPDRLDDLDPKPPRDPFDGQSLRYRRTETGCRIYSVGRNRRDDGGVNASVDDKAGEGKDDILFQLFDPQHRNKKLPEKPSGK